MSGLEFDDQWRRSRGVGGDVFSAPTDVGSGRADLTVVDAREIQ